MAAELELKAVVPDVAALRARLQAVGARLAYAGLMHDRRYDRDGELAARDEVLRVRTTDRGEAPPLRVLAWKGPTGTSSGGYKAREEYECRCDGAEPSVILQHLGYREVHAIDRWVEIYELAGATMRLEFYPRMDRLVEVEGPPDAIEAAIARSALPRTSFSAEPLAAFVSRFEARHGEPALLAAADPPGLTPWWT